MGSMKKHVTWTIFSIVFILTLWACPAFAQGEGQLTGENRIITSEDVHFEFDSIIYSPGYTCPKVTVDGLTEGIDYSVNISEVFDNPGTFTIFVDGLNQYSGSISVPFLVKHPVPKLRTEVDDYSGYINVYTN